MNNIKIQTEIDNSGTKKGLAELNSLSKKSVDNVKSTFDKLGQSFKDSFDMKSAKASFDKLEKFAKEAGTVMITSIKRATSSVEKEIKDMTAKSKVAFDRLATNTKKSFETMEKSAKGLKDVLSGPAGIVGLLAGVAGVAGIATLVEDFRETARQIALVNKETSTSIATIETLRVATLYAGGSMDEVVDSMKDFNKNVGEAKSGNADFTKTFKELNVTLTGGTGPAIKATLESLAKMSDQGKQSEAMVMGMKIFGESFQKTFGDMISGGLEPFQKSWDKFSKEGVFNEKNVAKAENFRKFMVKLKLDFQAWFSDVMPIINGLQAGITNMFSKLGISFNADKLDGTIRKIIANIKEALITIVKVIGSIREQFAKLSAVFKSIGFKGTVDYIFDSMKLKALETFKIITKSLGEMFGDAAKGAGVAQKEILMALSRGFSIKTKTIFDYNEIDKQTGLYFSAAEKAGRPNIGIPYGKPAVDQDSNRLGAIQKLNAEIQKYTNKSETKFKEYVSAMREMVTALSGEETSIGNDKLSIDIENLKKDIDLTLKKADAQKTVNEIKGQTAKQIALINNLEATFLEGYNSGSKIDGSIKTQEELDKEAEAAKKLQEAYAKLQAQAAAGIRGGLETGARIKSRRAAAQGQAKAGILGGLAQGKDIQEAKDAAKTERDETMSAVKEQFQMWSDLQGQAMGLWSSFDALRQAQTDRDLAATEKKRTAELNGLTITNRARLREEEKLQKELEASRNKAKEGAKPLKKAQVGMNTAAGLSAMWLSILEDPSAPFWSMKLALGATGSAMMLANMGAQMAMIEKYETGGIVPGTSFSGDNRLARVNSGEIIANSQQTKAVWDMMNGKGQGGPQINLTIQGNIDSDSRAKDIENTLYDLYSNNRLSFIGAN